MTAVALMPLAAGDPARYASLAATLAILTGALCLCGRILRLGFLADLLSKPVLVGYMAGVALIMIVGQLEKVSGVPVSGEGFAVELASFAGDLSQVSWPTVIMPGLLVATLPTLAWADVSVLILPAIGVAFVGYTDNVLTARAFALKHGQPIDANQEWTALGAANISSSLLHGFPVSSSGSRTALGVAVGARSQLYSLVALSLVLLTLMAAGPLLAGFPRPALGALVIYAAVRLIDLPEIRRIARFRRSELVLTILTTAAVLGFGVLIGVLVAVALSVVDLLRRVARPHDGILGYVPGVSGMHDIDDYPSAKRIPGLLVYRYDAPLCFANAEDFRRRALAAVDRDNCADTEGGEIPVEWFVINAEANVEIDITAADALEQLRTDLHYRGLTFAMARVKQELRNDLTKAGLVDKIGADLIFPTLPTAVAAYLGAYETAHGQLPAGVRQLRLPTDPLEGGGLDQPANR
jgi:sulfate permease, SulP family